MLQITRNQSLKKYNTFGVDANAAFFAEPQTVHELEETMNFAAKNKLEHLIIGEGSNLLFTRNYSGLIIHPLFKDLNLIEESGKDIVISAGSGVNWDAFVEHCVSKGWYGAENLSLIPGSVGAAPVQNIGAYGVEAKDIIENVNIFNISEGKSMNLSNDACNFGYRDSIFKHDDPARHVVTSVVFRLSKMGEFKLGYGKVKEKFLERNEQSLAQLRETIVEIRNSKLPDPEETGNAGSFFKNPVVNENFFLNLKVQFESIPGFQVGEGIKIPAAWLIEKSGLKGIRRGNFGTWPNQPLVIVNYGNATGQEIFQFSEEIRQHVFNNFNIELEREVTLVP